MPFLNISEMENRARIIRRRTNAKDIDAQFEWIPDLRFTKAKENLYNRTIELSWQLKTILGLALQEKSQAIKTLEDKMDKLYDKFTVYMEIFHHMCFVTDSPHYALLKRQMTTM